MELLVDKVDDVTVVVVDIEFLDANNSRDLKDRLGALAETGDKLLIDLHRVQFMDSAGCGALLSTLKRLRETGGDMKVCCVTSPVRALFDLVRMHRIFGVFKTREEALQAFRGAS